MWAAEIIVKCNCKLKATAAAGLTTNIGAACDSDSKQTVAYQAVPSANAPVQTPQCKRPSAKQQAADPATTNRPPVPSVTESIVTLHVCGEADKLLRHCTCLTVTGVLLLSWPLL